MGGGVRGQEVLVFYNTETTKEGAIQGKVGGSRQ